MYGRRPEQARDWVWKSSRRWPPSGWRVRCSLMPAAMLDIHGAALRVLWGLLEANPLRRCARQAPPVGAIDYRLHAPRPEEGQSSAATGYAGALAPKAPPRRQLAGAGLWGSCQPAESQTSDLACSVCFPRAASNRLPRKRTSVDQDGVLPSRTKTNKGGLHLKRRPMSKAGHPVTRRRDAE